MMMERRSSQFIVYSILDLIHAFFLHSFVNIREVNELTSSRPKEWSLERWLAYWAEGQLCFLSSNIPIMPYRWE